MILVIQTTNATYIGLADTLNYNKRWYKSSLSDRKNMQRLFAVLAKSKTGRFLIKKARAKSSGKELYHLVRPGASSFTDTTLLRQFKGDSAKKLKIKSLTKVSINRYLKTMDAVLDLAHEVAHFAFKNAFNPYKKSFKLKNFIRSTIEGKGGEVDAYLFECRVYKELFPQLVWSSNCARIFNDKSQKFSRKDAIKEFYKVGKYFELMQTELAMNKNNLARHFPFSKRPARLLSSAYGVPYPVAAIFEYKTVIKKVCENDFQRILLLKNKSKDTISTQYAGLQKSSLFQLEKRYFKRCVSKSL